MIFTLNLITILQSVAISIGVGGSTFAILNFFNALQDGVIDDTERRMMGVVYTVLRIAMVAILLTTLALFHVQYVYNGLESFSVLQWAQLFTLFILFLNAGMMTAHIMPSTFGPAIQAGNWYALGLLTTLKPLPDTDFTVLEFGLSYITWLVLAVCIVNGAMAYMKAHRHGLIKK